MGQETNPKMSIVTTPKRNTPKAFSITDCDDEVTRRMIHGSDRDSGEEEAEEMDSRRTGRRGNNNNDNNNNNNNVLETPSPPTNRKGSSVSMSFLATPIRSRLESMSHGQQSHSENVNTIRRNSANVHMSPLSANRSRLLPPTTPKTRSSEVFLSPSPMLKSPGTHGSGIITKDSNKPIKEISNNLKTRLNYAFVKLQNGWVDKSLPELENELDSTNNNLLQLSAYRLNNNSISPRKLVPPKQHTTYVNKFAQGNGMEDESIFKTSPVKKYCNTSTNNTNHNNNSTIPNDGTTSAHLAFLHALSSPKSPIRNTDEIHMNASPLRWTGPNNHSNTPVSGSNCQSPVKPLITRTNTRGQIIKTDKQGKPMEAAAIETLMALSSPQKSKPSTRIGAETTTDKNKEGDHDTDVETETDSC